MEYTLYSVWFGNTFFWGGGWVGLGFRAQDRTGPLGPQNPPPHLFTMYFLFFFWPPSPLHHIFLPLFPPSIKYFFCPSSPSIFSFSSSSYTYPRTRNDNDTRRFSHFFWGGGGEGGWCLLVLISNPVIRRRRCWYQSLLCAGACWYQSLLFASIIKTRYLPVSSKPFVC